MSKERVRVATLLAAATLFFSVPVDRLPAEQRIEEFRGLSGWKELSFRNIDKPSSYESAEEGDLLRIRSEGGASMLVLEEEFDVYDTPRMSWRWRVTEDVERQALRTKEGDDAAIRLYVAFRRPLSERSLGGRIWAGMQENLYGEVPPDSALSFVWSSGESGGAAFPSSYTEQQFLVVPEPAENQEFVEDTWLEHQVNLIDLYRKLFGEDPPAEAFVAVMGDSDNTDGSTEAWLDYLHITGE